MHVKVMWMATSVYLICDIFFFQSIQYSDYPTSRVVYKEIYKNSILYGKGINQIEYSLSLFLYYISQCKFLMYIFSNAQRDQQISEQKLIYLSIYLSLSITSIVLVRVQKTIPRIIEIKKIISNSLKQV